MKVRGRLLVAAGVLLLTAAAGWWGWRELQLDADAALAAAMPASPTAQGLAGAWLKPATAGSAAPGGAASSALPTPAADAGSDDEVVEICGLGRVSKRQAQAWSPVEMLKAKAQMDALERRKDAALSQLSARLAAGADGERVVARLLMGDVEGAALIAARSNDAMAYRLALQSCRGRADSASEPSCRGLTAQTWARLDPQDAAPRLWLLGEAVARRDDTAANEALEQVMQRQQRSTTRPLLTVVGRVQVVEGDAVGMGLAMTEVFGMESALPDISHAYLGRYCSAKAVKDDVRRARCERLARWQFTHANDLTEAGMALVLADRVGLPADQRPYTREQLKQAQDRMLEDAVLQSGSDCGSLARAADLPARLLDRNEVQQFLLPLSGR